MGVYTSSKTAAAIDAAVTKVENFRTDSIAGAGSTKYFVFDATGAYRFACILLAGNIKNTDKCALLITFDPSSKRVYTNVIGDYSDGFVYYVKDNILAIKLKNTDNTRNYRAWAFFGDSRQTINVIENYNVSTFEEVKPISNSEGSFLDTINGNSLDAVEDRYYTSSSNIGTLAITLPNSTYIGDRTAKIRFLFTTGSTPNISFTSTVAIMKEDGFAIVANSTYEITALYCKTYWLLSIKKFIIQS